ncbi:Mitochondrial ribosomal protein L27, partial [Prunus dulcis]
PYVLARFPQLFFSRKALNPLQWQSHNPKPRIIICTTSSTSEPHFSLFRRSEEMALGLILGLGRAFRRKRTSSLDILSSKRAPRDYYKGKNCKPIGFHTRKAGEITNYVVPDLTDFKLKPYVSQCPREFKTRCETELVSLIRRYFTRDTINTSTKKLKTSCWCLKWRGLLHKGEL